MLGTMLPGYILQSIFPQLPSTFSLIYVLITGAIIVVLNRFVLRKKVIEVLNDEYTAAISLDAADAFNGVNKLAVTRMIKL